MSGGLQKFPEFSSMFRAGQPTQQGGAVYTYSADVTIYDTEFISNSASIVRA
jgi:hypothetical protein